MARRVLIPQLVLILLLKIQPKLVFTISSAFVGGTLNLRVSQRTRQVATQVNDARKMLQQHKSDWNLNDGDIEDAVKRLQADGVQLPFGDLTEDATLLRLFLYAKGLLKEEKTDERVVAFKNLLAGEYPARLQRLRRIVTKGEDSAEVKDDDNTFTSFVSKHPMWASADTSYVVFRDDARLGPTGLVERVQLSGLCYMHAPVVLQSYLVSKGTAASETRMLDLASFIRQHQSAKELKRHVWDDEGGSSEGFLEQTLQNKTGKNVVDASLLVDPVLGRTYSNWVVRRLKSDGPALVARFRVFPEFQDEKATWVHLGASGTLECRGLHAMVLVGHRKAEGGEDRFLLQNWWKEKAFVEVDPANLASCSASLVFVSSQQTDIPQQFARNSARHVELEMTLAERLPNEMSNER